MSIQQQPDVLSLSMNLKPIIVQSTAETVTFTLKKNGEVLLSQSYQTDKNGQVQIDLRQMVHESLQTIVSDVGIVYTQADLVADFSALIDMDTVNFRVVRGGVDRLADSATNFLTQNFLTWHQLCNSIICLRFNSSRLVRKVSAKFDCTGNHSIVG